MSILPQQMSSRAIDSSHGVSVSFKDPSEFTHTWGFGCCIDSSSQLTSGATTHPWGSGRGRTIPLRSMRMCVVSGVWRLPRSDFFCNLPARLAKLG